MIARPILFSGAMVRALLDGGKTQTRRACKPMNQWVEQECREVRAIDGTPHHFLKGATEPLEKLRCPYGQPGDRLWVRETFLDTQGTGIEHRDESGLRHRYAFAADCAPGSYGDHARKDYGLKWKPSIHMPRVASRILLEIVAVRVERLQDITEGDAWAEGVDKAEVLSMPCADGATAAYSALWQRINGAGSWEANPWVWVVEFKRVMPCAWT